VGSRGQQGGGGDHRQLFGLHRFAYRHRRQHARGGAAAGAGGGGGLALDDNANIAGAAGSAGCIRVWVFY
jgi:hypothetical protein